MRHRALTAVLASLLAASLAACVAPATSKRISNAQDIAEEAHRQRQIALDIRRKREQRLLDVSLPILSASVPYCDRRRTSTYGFRFGDLAVFDAEWQRAALSVYGADSRPRVLVVMRDSPAEQADLRPGDELVQVGGVDVASSEAARNLIAAAQQRGGRTPFIIRRNGVLRQMHLRPVTVCDYGVHLLSDGVQGIDPNSINAFADGENIYFTPGMMRFAETPEELALVVAHEIAHNIMNHVDAKKTNASLGYLIDLLLAGATGVNTGGALSQIGALAYSQDFEAEADYIGLYLMANAGFDIDRAEYFWRRMAAENPGSIASYGSTHPSPPERFLNIASTVREIGRKRLRGQALVPDFDQ